MQLADIDNHIEPRDDIDSDNKSLSSTGIKKAPMRASTMLNLLGDKLASKTVDGIASKSKDLEFRIKNLEKRNDIINDSNRRANDAEQSVQNVEAVLRIALEK